MTHVLPGAVHLIAPPERLSFFHQRTETLPVEVAPLEAWNRMTAQPLPLLGTAFRIRDAISARFGVERIGGFSGRRRETVAVGDRLDFFLVEHVSDEALALTARDTHLEVMTCLAVDGRRLTLASSVATRNAFGRAYMLPVAPAHRLIVGAMLRRLRRDLAKG